MMFSADAIERKYIDEYVSFSGAIAQMSLLAKSGNVFRETKDEIDMLIADWKKSGVRSNALKLLAKHGFDIAEADDLVVIEWGGGGILYRALYLSKTVFFVRESSTGDLSVEKKEINGDVRNNAALIKEIIEKKKYAGDISGGGSDIPTFIVTIIGAGHKTAIIYDAPPLDVLSGKRKPNDNEKNTLFLMELIWKIRRAYGIKPESGA